MKNDKNYLIKFLILVSFIYLSILPCFAYDSGTGNLKVYVIDKSTGEVIEGAYVNIILNETEIEKRTNEYGYSYFTSLNSGNYDISVKADKYISDHIEARVYENKTETIEIKLDKSPYPEEKDINIGDLKISPQYICINEDKRIYISIPIELEEGNDVEFTVKFYLYDGDRWDYLGKEKRTLDEDDEKTFDVSYNYQADTFDKGVYEIKAEIEYNDIEKIEYAYLIIKDCDKKEPDDKIEPEDSDFKISSITLNPTYPILDEMNIVRVLIRPEKNIEKYQTIRVEAWIDGKFERYEYIDFGYMEFSKTFKFAFDTANYGIGYHTMKIIIISPQGISENIKTFYIAQERTEESIIIKSFQKHCLKIKDINLINSPVKTGDQAEIKVIVENCGTYMERNIILKLNTSGKILSELFDLKKGAEREIIFRINNSKTENLSFKLQNGYNNLNKTYELVTYTGILYIEPEPIYIIKNNEDNIIRLLIKNIGKVKDDFELIFPEDIAKWLKDYPKTVELDSGESKIIEIIMRPNLDPGENRIKIILKTENYESFVELTIKVEEIPDTSTKNPLGDITGVTPYPANQWFVFNNITIQKCLITTVILVLLLIVVLLVWILYKSLKEHRLHLKKEEKVREISGNLNEETVSVNSKNYDY